MSADRAVVVRITKVYGNEAIYPACNNAATFAALTGKKTLSRADLMRIRILGFDVVVQPTALDEALQ